MGSVKDVGQRLVGCITTREETVTVNGGATTANGDGEAGGVDGEAIGRATVQATGEANVRILASDVNGRSRRDDGGAYERKERDGAKGEHFCLEINECG